MTKPKFKDCCDHGIECFAGTIQRFEKSRNRMKNFDVYVFCENDESRVCIRYGSSHSEYISPGKLIDFALTANKYKFDQVVMAQIDKIFKINVIRK